MLTIPLFDDAGRLVAESRDVAEPRPAGPWNFNRSADMRVFFIVNELGEFLTETGEYVNDIRRARNFGTREQAMFACALHDRIVG